MASCASCGKTEDLLRCKTCRQVWYCSKICQRADFKEHKKVCRFVAPSYVNDRTTTDALSKLRQVTANLTIALSKNVAKCFSTAEIRMAILSLLPAMLNVSAAPGIARSASRKSSSRLFLAPGPGKLVLAAYEGTGNKIAMGIEPRNKDQLRHATDIAKGGEGHLHLVTSASGQKEEKRAATLERAGISIIINPFFTKLWSQDPTNMTNKPYITVSTDEKTASWRRMQLTSPPTLEVDMSVWYTNPSGKGNQARPGTGKVATGVTMGHLADLLATLPSKHKLHWMSLDSHAWWARSADAVVVPAPMQEGGKNEGMRGVYVNPSNGIPFPGAF